MKQITEEQYKFALARIEELLPLVDDNMPSSDKFAIELKLMSDLVISYEKEHYPIGKPSVAELIKFSIEDKGITQKQLSELIGVSASRINDFVSGRALPNLKVAHSLCRELQISPSAMLGF